MFIVFNVYLDHLKLCVVCINGRRFVNQKNDKYAHGSVGARVRLMVRGGCQPVRGSKGMEWKYDDDLCVWGTKETEMHVLLECKCYDLVRRRWMRT